MNFIISFLMLATPGVIAVYVHNRKTKDTTRENWQSMIPVYLIYSFFIMLAVIMVMWLQAPGYIMASDSLSVSFILKYSMLATVVALVLPWLWSFRAGLLRFAKKSKTFKIGKDE